MEETDNAPSTSPIRRIRVIFPDSSGCTLKSNPRLTQRWVLVPSNVRVVGDLCHCLARQVKSKMGRNPFLLELNDFVLPPMESIDILRETDVVTLRSELSLLDLKSSREEGDGMDKGNGKRNGIRKGKTIDGEGKGKNKGKGKYEGTRSGKGKSLRPGAPDRTTNKKFAASDTRKGKKNKKRNLVGGQVGGGDEDRCDKRLKVVKGMVALDAAAAQDTALSGGLPAKALGKGRLNAGKILSSRDSKKMSDGVNALKRVHRVKEKLGSKGRSSSVNRGGKKVLKKTGKSKSFAARSVVTSCPPPASSSSPCDSSEDDSSEESSTQGGSEVANGRGKGKAGAVTLHNDSSSEDSSSSSSNEENVTSSNSSKKTSTGRVSDLANGKEGKGCGATAHQITHLHPPSSSSSSSSNSSSSTSSSSSSSSSDEDSDSDGPETPSTPHINTKDATSPATTKDPKQNGGSRTSKTSSSSTKSVRADTGIKGGASVSTTMAVVKDMEVKHPGSLPLRSEDDTALSPQGRGRGYPHDRHSLGGLQGSLGNEEGLRTSGEEGVWESGRGRGYGNTSGMASGTYWEGGGRGAKGRRRSHGEGRLLFSGYKKDYTVIASVHSKEKDSTQGLNGHLEETRRYLKFPEFPVDMQPLPGDVLAFKILSLNEETWTPELSDFMEGETISFDKSSGLVKFRTPVEPGSATVTTGDDSSTLESLTQPGVSSSVVQDQTSGGDGVGLIAKGSTAKAGEGADAGGQRELSGEKSIEGVDKDTEGVERFE
ncbi:unnamed protein product, partial [Choristocarpus tenellus]